MRYLLALAVLVVTIGAMPAVGAAQPTLLDKYLHAISDKPKIEPHSYSQVPPGKPAKDYYTCGTAYCDSGDSCCTNQSDWTSYCCPQGYRCDSYGGCW